MSTNKGQETELERSSASRTFLERLANRVGFNAKASAVFADPIERDGVTVIPVAKPRWGFGGGAGSGRDADESRAGEGSGGGGVMASPVGYIQLKDGNFRFRPIYDTGTMLQLFIGVGIVTILVLRSLRKLVRSR